VPAARSGVASAMNTVARMVSGALGVAVVGSLVNSLYADDLGALPGPAEESIGAARAVAAHLPPEPGHALLAAASDAYVQAMGIGLTVGAALSVLTAAVVSRRLKQPKGV
jgi:DHA2 family multidrug resistance protein-like MFS transporter